MEGDLWCKMPMSHVVLLVDRAIHHHQLRFAWCMEDTPYHGVADISIPFLDATVH